MATRLRSSWLAAKAWRVMRDSSHVPRPRNFMIEKLVFIRRFPCELPQATLTPPLSRAEGRFPPTLQNKNPTQGRILILVDGVAHDGSLFGEDGTEAMFFELVLFSAEVLSLIHI